MKLQFPISLPRRDDGTILPAVLAGLLLAGAIAQLLWSGSLELPPETVGHVQPLAGDAAMSNVTVPPVIGARPLFSPSRSASGSGAGQSTASPLGGVVVAGTLARGRQKLAFLRMPDGTVSRLAIGGEVNGWRLAVLGDSEAKFTRSGETLTVPFGSSGGSISGHKKDDDEEEDEE